MTPSTLSKNAKWLQNGKTLEQISSIQQVLCGWMLCIRGTAEASIQKSRFFPSSPGNGVFFDPKTIIDFTELTLHPDNCYLLITYTSQAGVYVLNEEDPHTHFLKNYGYSFGDKLIDKYHPILSR